MGNPYLYINEGYEKGFKLPNGYVLGKGRTPLNLTEESDSLCDEELEVKFRCSEIP